MVCRKCRDAGEMIANMVVDELTQLRHMIADATDLHGQCEGGCDCQHRVPKAGRG